PLGVDAYRVGMSGEENLVWRWRAGTLDTAGSFHFPKKSTLINYRLDNHGEKREISSGEFTVTDVQVGHDYPASTFWPVYQPGVQVIDTVIAKKIYQFHPEKA